MDFIKENKKKVGIILFSAIVLGGVSYGMMQSQPESNNDQVTQVSKPNKKAKEKSILDRLKENEDSSILDKVTAGEDKSDLIQQASGADKTLLSPSSLANDLSNFDKQAKISDNNKVTDEILIPKNTPRVENMSNPTNQSNNKKENSLNEPDDQKGNNDQVIVKPEEPTNPTPPVIPTPEPPVTPTPEPPVTPTPEPTNYSGLISMVEQAKLHSKGDYVSSTYQSLENEVRFADRMIADQNSTQDQVNVQIVRLQEAINNLVRRGNKSELEGKINEAAAIDRSIYTQETLTTLDTAVSAANELLIDIDATQVLIDQRVSQLVNALGGLKKLDEPDLTLVFLNRLIQECEQMDLSEYTPQSVAAYQPVFDQSKAFVSQSGITEESAKQQLEALQSAKDQLVKKANTSALQALVNEVNSLNQSEYTSESWAAVAAALTAAEQTLLDENATQEQVDSAKTVLEQAKSNLVKDQL